MRKKEKLSCNAFNDLHRLLLYCHLLFYRQTQHILFDTKIAHLIIFHQESIFYWIIFQICILNLILIRQIMKQGVLGINIVLAFVYAVLAGLTCYILKLSTRPQAIHKQKQQPLSIAVNMPLYRMMAWSWFKKYTLFGSVMNKDKKYLAKQLLILSAFAVGCLKINKITLWPITFITFLMPTIFLLYEMLAKYISQKFYPKTESNPIKSINQGQIQIKPIEVNPITVQQGIITQKNKKIPQKQKQSRNMVEIGIMCAISFISWILFMQTAMILGNSISNSGQLNITSLLSIIAIDQLLIRPSTGLVLIATIKLLQKLNKIQIHSNKLVVNLCLEELVDLLIQQTNNKEKINLQSTEGYLQHKEDPCLRHTNAPISIGLEFVQYVDLQNNKPNIQVQVQPQVAQSSKSFCDSHAQEIFLTTPQREMFQGENIINHHNQTIIDILFQNKQNAETVNNRPRLYSQHVQTKCFEQLVLTNDPLQDIQNFKPKFQHQIQTLETIATRNKNANNRRKNKRVLKLTGNSPYLQYLPNMLKNVRKGANTTSAANMPKISQHMLR